MLRMFDEQPILGNGRALNHLQSAAFAAITWAAVCGMIAAGISQRFACLRFVDGKCCDVNR